MACESSKPGVLLTSYTRERHLSAGNVSTAAADLQLEVSFGPITHHKLASRTESGST